MRLYHTPGSRSNRVRWLLEEIGAPYELVELTSAERKELAHRARHPLGRVPVIEDGEGPIFESAAICLQIADLHPEAKLVPAVGSHERGLVYQWVVYAMSELEPGGIEHWRYAESDPERAAAGVERYRVAAQVVEDALGTNDYLVGGAFSVADVVVSAVLGIGVRFDLNGDLPNIAAYIERLNARPAYLRASAK